jgi:hypothetical protein
MDIWYDEPQSNNFIGIFDYGIFDDYIKIIGLSINDHVLLGYHESMLTESESQELMKSIIQHVKNVAQQENKPKIILDVHHNLRLYKKYFYPNGFIVTNRKCSDNPFWFESELDINTSSYHFK